MKKKQTLSVKLKGCFFGAETLAVGRGSWDEAPCTVAECRLIGVQCRNSMKKYKYGKRKIMMTKNCRYATINSKHYISVSGTT